MEERKEGGEERRRKVNQQAPLFCKYDWRFTFGISIDELALRYDTCLRGREKRRDVAGLTII